MDPSAEQTTYRVAVFDFDGTSIRGQSGALFTEYLILNLSLIHISEPTRRS